MAIKHRARITYSDESYDDIYISSTGVITYVELPKELGITDHSKMIALVKQVRDWLKGNGGTEFRVREEEE